MAETSTPTVPAPVRERGYTVPSDTSADWWWSELAGETTPELQWPASLATFDRMEDTDSQVSSVLRAVRYPILRTGWRVDGTGCRPEVTRHVAQDLGLPIVGQGNDIPVARTRGRFSFVEHLDEALDCLKYGHTPFEQVYRVGDDGLLHLRKLGVRRPQSIAKWNIARDGGLISIEQRPPAGTVGVASLSATNITLPVSRLVVYVFDKRGGRWIGRSLLRPAYKNVILKDRLLRVQTTSIDRNGMGVPVYTGAEGEQSLAAGKALARQVRAGDDSGAALPYGAKLELTGVSGALPNAQDPINYHDEQIARAVLAHFLNLGSKTGSWALGETFADFFTLSLQAIAEMIRDTATAHIVEDLVDVNYGPDEPAPRLVFDEIGSRGAAIVNAVAQLVNSGVLRPDEDLEQFIRTQLGLPGYGGDQPFPTTDQTVPADHQEEAS